MSFSIIPAALICLVRYKTIHYSYRPFIYLTLLSFASEVLSAVFSYSAGSNAIVSNIYVLAEWILLVWLMYYWITGKRKRRLYIYLGIVLTFLWLANTLVAGSVYRFNSVYRIAYSFVLVFMAIDHLNTLIFSGSRPLFANARFLLSCSFIIYFSYKAILETLYLFHLSDSQDFQRVIFIVMACINLFCNLIFIIISLCLPPKPRFTLPYS